MYKNRHKPAVCPKCGCELTQKNAKGTKVKVVLLHKNECTAVFFTLDFLHECPVVFVSTHDAVTLFFLSVSPFITNHFREKNNS